MGGEFLWPAVGADGLEMRLHALQRVGGKDLRQRLAGGLIGVAAEQAARGRIGLDDAVTARVQYHHRLGRHLEQQAVARFDVAHARIIAFQRFLRHHQALLQRRHGAQVAPERHHAAIPADGDGAIKHRNGMAVGGGVIDMAPFRLGVVRGGVGQQMGNLRTAVGDDGGDQLAADPVAAGVEVVRQFFALQGDVANGAVGIDDQGDVGGTGNKGCN